jgi:uncharacterized membrane protein
MIRGSTCILAVASAIGVALAVPAQAELTLCNRTSYRLDAAIGLEKRANVATRGWFRIDPGACRQVVGGPLDVDMVYVHGRTPPVYGSAPLPQANHAELCIRDGDFEIANARGCPLNQQARFTAAQPSDSPKGPTVNLAEEADYDDAQARLAGIQRLLAIVGYDAYPIDGVEGAKTQASIAKFLADHKLPPDSASKPDFFDVLLAAAAKPEGRLFLVQRYQIPGDGCARRGRDGRDRQPRLVWRRAWQMSAARSARRSAPALQLCRGGRRQRPHDPAQRCGARLGRQCRALHTRRQVRVE